MSEVDDDILAAIKTWVWSGFYTPEEVNEMLDEQLEPDGDEDMLRAAVEREFDAKHAAEATWPDETDCDRLDLAFAALERDGIISLQNAGYTMSDGLSDVGEALNERVRANVKGYCFYHEQDLGRAVRGGGLMLAFGDLDDDPAKKAAIGRAVKRALETTGLKPEWDGDPEKRISIPKLDWRRRTNE